MDLRFCIYARGEFSNASLSDSMKELYFSHQSTKENAAIDSYFGVFSRFDLYKTISLI